MAESTLKLILDIYKNIYTHPQSKYAIAEYMILEKMFGLKTIDSFVRKFSTDEDLINNIRNISPSMQKLIRLGYTNLHDKLIEKVKVQSKNILETNANGDIENDSEYLDYDALEDIIDDFLYPVCTECMQIILNDIMNYLKARKVEDRIAIVEKMVQICSKYNKNLFSISEISQNEKCSLKIFKSLYDIPDEISKTEIINYVIDEWDLKEITTEKLESKTDELDINVFDIRYEDLTYIVKQEYDDLFNYTREELLNDCLEARHKMDEKK